jgi:SPP1 family predicted phage head-tail adaptor
MISFKPPAIGQYTKRMAVYAVAVDDTTDGGTDETPSVFTMIWCAIESLGGLELWYAKEQQEKVSHRIRCAYQPGISPQMHGIYNGRKFNFTSVVDKDERHVELEILATEIVSQ